MSGRESWTTLERRIKPVRREALHYETAFVRFVSNSFIALTRAITKFLPELADFLTRRPEIGGVLFAGRDALLFSRVFGRVKVRKGPVSSGWGSDRQGQVLVRLSHHRS